METNERFCPICKNKNERSAVTCKHCGAFLGYHPWDASATTINTDALEKGYERIAESLIDDAMIPKGGLAIYAAGASRPLYLAFDKELVLGRQRENEYDKSLIDLSEVGGYQMGLSRRHAMIRKTETGFELIDLGSTNGSWLNDERLVPNKPYQLASGSQLRFGRMRLLVLYHSLSRNKKVE